MFAPTRSQVRHFFISTWQKMQNASLLIGAEQLAAKIIAKHSEYHSILQNPESYQQEWDVSGGQINPFLHLSLHLAVAEQLTINQPKGIIQAYNKLLTTHEQHHAEHILIDCLGEAIWNLAQKNTDYKNSVVKNSEITKKNLGNPDLAKLDLYMQLVEKKLNS